MLYTERLYWMKTLTYDIFMCATHFNIAIFRQPCLYYNNGGKRNVCIARTCFSILRFVVYSLHQKFYYACNVSY